MCKLCKQVMRMCYSHNHECEQLSALFDKHWKNYQDYTRMNYGPADDEVALKFSYDSLNEVDSLYEFTDNKLALYIKDKAKNLDYLKYRLDLARQDYENASNKQRKINELLDKFVLKEEPLSTLYEKIIGC